MEILFDAIVAVKSILLAFLRSWLLFFFAGFKKKCVRGEIILITGAGSGMGQGMAVEFARLGAVLVLWDISKAGLEETVELIKAVDGVYHTYICDVSDRLQVQRTAELMKADVGDVTMLVNNAGVVAGRKILDLTDAQIERTFQVNLFGPIWTTKQFLPSMLENNHGHIVNMASSCGLIGLSHLTDYSSSKFGLVGFTQTLHHELQFSGHDGVHTTLVCPAYVTTGMFHGCQIKSPSVCPALKPDYVVKCIMKGILSNQTEVYIPRLIYIMCTLKTLLPVTAMLEIIRFFKADIFMETFVGREKPGDGVSIKEE